MSAYMKGLYEGFGDFLREVPEAEDAVAMWKAKRSLQAARYAAERRLLEQREAAWKALCKRMDAAPQPTSVQ